MTKTSQTSFASRIGKAETLFSSLSSFNNYNPGDESLSLNGIRALIDDLYTIQENHATRHAGFIAAVHARFNLFYGTMPLSKTMTMAKNYVAALYGKESDKTRNVNAIVTKIRGEKPVKVTTAAGESSISRSEKSFGARHVNLLYLISTLTGFGTEYAPSNPDITIEALSALAMKIKAANDEAVLAYQDFHPLVALRQEAFRELASRTMRVKKMVLAQYGSGSQEYKSVKGLDFRTDNRF